MKMIIKKLPVLALPLVGCVLALCVLAFAVYYHTSATTLGNDIGQGTGTLVGKAIGSLEGITTGRQEGMAAGKAEGLSANDTTVDVGSEIRSIGNLEVLVASVKISDFQAIGQNLDYAALYLMRGNVVFSVDLSEAEVETRDDGLHVTLPLPKGLLYIDQSRVEKIAEYEKNFFKGSAVDGFIATLNSMEKVQTASTETLDNYSYLLEQAKISAEKQVQQLVQAVAINAHHASVGFKED